MRRCLELAQKGLGMTYPNPMVGCVIVYNGQIIGEGWHHKAGEEHAEVNAIQSVQDKSLLQESTLYVNLEPCNHHGRTPPCATRIIKEKIPKVVVGCLDPFKKVDGQGIDALKTSGVTVTTGILEEEAKQLNSRFLTYHLQKRPYIILKWAESADGYLAPLQKNRNRRAPVYLTKRPEQVLVHQWRSQEQAILVGAQTVIDDNPSLTTRWIKGKNPLRVVIDPNGRLGATENVFDGQADHLHLTHKSLGTTKSDSPTTILMSVLSTLYAHEIGSVLVEGGKKTLQSFIDSELWDEARIFSAPVYLREGIAAPKLVGTAIPSPRPHLQLIQRSKKQFETP